MLTENFVKTIKLHRTFKSRIYFKLKLHDTVYKIRCQAIELHKDDINHLITSVQSSIKCGRRSASVEPPMLPTGTVPLYNRRRSRSLDTGARSRVVNSVGVRYVQYPSLSDPAYVELMQSLGKLKLIIFSNLITMCFREGTH